MRRITGEDVRPGNEFEYTTPPRNKAASTFVAILPDEIRVTRRATDLFALPASTPVLAHWHGERRTDGFATTVGELKAKAVLFD